MDSQIDRRAAPITLQATPVQRDALSEPAPSSCHTENRLDAVAVATRAPASQEAFGCSGGDPSEPHWLQSTERVLPGTPLAGFATPYPDVFDERRFASPPGVSRYALVHLLRRRWLPLSLGAAWLICVLSTLAMPNWNAWRGPTYVGRGEIADGPWTGPSAPIAELPRRVLREADDLVNLIREDGADGETLTRLASAVGSSTDEVGNWMKDHVGIDALHGGALYSVTVVGADRRQIEAGTRRLLETLATAIASRRIRILDAQVQRLRARCDAVTSEIISEHNDGARSANQGRPGDDERLRKVVQLQELQASHAALRERMAELDAIRSLVAPVVVGSSITVDNRKLRGEIEVLLFLAVGFAPLALVVYAAVVWDLRRRYVNGAADIYEGLGMRVLGTLPPTKASELLANENLASAQSVESTDRIRAAILHAATEDSRHVILVTSAEARAGTTIFASHLALSLARGGRRTLLIDGDLRAPNLGELFGLGEERGFCEALRSEIDVVDAVTTSQTENLWLLPAGTCDGVAVQALATDQAASMIDSLRSHFAFIIIDGPALFSVSDSLSLGRQADGVILTVRRDHSDARSIGQAAELLQDLGMHVLGAVVNGVPDRVDRRVGRLQESLRQR